MKLYLMILIILFSITDLFARKIIEEQIEPAILEVRYARIKVLDTLNIDNDFRKDLLTLKIGKKVSAFYSAELKTIDSLEYRDKAVAMARLENYQYNQNVAKLPGDAVFKNYPEGKVRVHDRFDLCQWIIDETLEKPHWHITDSIKRIMGYECIFAYTEYRGRRWDVWYTPEIPISDGPWKLCGLPGLIIYATDSRGHYLYEAISLRVNNLGNVEYFDYDAGSRLKISREKALLRKWKSLHEDLRYIILSTGMYGVSDKSVKKRNHIPHTNYDFEETDYLHE